MSIKVGRAHGIKVYKSIAGDYFVLENNAKIFFYFTHEDVPAILKELRQIVNKKDECIEEEHD